MTEPREDQLDLGLLAELPDGRDPVDRAFGAANRARLLDQYFNDAATVTIANAWEHTYRLLLWIDRTIALAHCYESDKCRPGRPWYGRSLAFHDWVSRALDHTPRELADNIDVLFRRASSDLAVAAAAERLQPAFKQQWALYADREFPEPGEDPELEDIINEELRSHGASPLPAAAVRHLTQRVYAYMGEENKRKNLLGEGFEDTVAALIHRIPAISSVYTTMVRPELSAVDGFTEPRFGDKERKVDLILIRRRDMHRILVSCKWSVRSDREEQFITDYNDYVGRNRERPFDYVLVTNEFDPARLAAACGKWTGNSFMFSRVVHVNPEGPRAAYNAPGGPRRGEGVNNALAHMESGRLSSLAAWLSELAT